MLRTNMKLFIWWLARKEHCLIKLMTYWWYMLSSLSRSACKSCDQIFLSSKYCLVLGKKFQTHFKGCLFKETVKPEFSFIFKSSFCRCQIIISQYQPIKSDLNVLNLIFNCLVIDIYDISHFWSSFFWYHFKANIQIMC